MNNDFDPALRESLVDYLVGLYEGVFSQKAIEDHLENHIGFAFADYATQVIRPRLNRGDKVLDIGSGFGSCVLAAREAGLDAIGVEISDFEVEFARKRLLTIDPRVNATSVYICGDVRKLDFPSESLDAVTLWNVIEHIDDWGAVLEKITMFLKPGGLVFIICPNYFAWRDEAHYQVPWKPAPLLPKDKAVEYLISLGRDPRYFENAIFYRSNWEVLGQLRKFRYDIMDLGTFETRTIKLSNLYNCLSSPLKWVRFYNPFRHSVEVAARKPF